MDDATSDVPPAFDATSYGTDLAADYDVLYPPELLETDAAVELLTELAHRHAEPSLVEFGLGTGRLAVDVHRRGVRVAGIEASEDMVTALRHKDPEGKIEVVVGDYISARASGVFGVVALVFNNILDERGLTAQLSLFQNAARHLIPGGYFVVEAFVLRDDERDGNWSMSPRFVGKDSAEFQMVRYDIQTNRVERTFLHMRPTGPRFFQVADTYASPNELDLMAHVTGMKRVARYSDWSRSPFTSTSRRHVTVYQLATSPSEEESTDGE